VGDTVTDPNPDRVIHTQGSTPASVTPSDGATMSVPVGSNLQILCGRPLLQD
jgi:hypothetical protein